MTSVVRAFLEYFVPPHLLRLLDLDTLEFDDTEYISAELQPLYSDKVLRCGLQQLPATAFIAILMEHKSFIPRHPHFQISDYRQQIWNTATANKKSPPFVLPIVLYHGRQKWKKQRMEAYFKHLPADFYPYVGHFEYLLVDLSAYTDEALLRLKVGFLAFGLLMMKHAKDKAYLEREMKKIFSGGENFLNTEEGRIFVERLFVYFIRMTNMDTATLQQNASQALPPKSKRVLLSTYDQLKLEGKIEGKMEGKIEGKMEQALLVCRALLEEFPNMPDERIALLSGATLEVVQEERRKHLAGIAAAAGKKSAKASSGAAAKTSAKKPVKQRK